MQIKSITTTDTQIRLAARIDATGRLSGPHLTLVNTGADNLSWPNGYIVRLGFGLGARFRSFPAAVRNFDAKREKLGYTVIP